jgi:hypothetical protein
VRWFRNQSSHVTLRLLSLEYTLRDWLFLLRTPTSIERPLILKEMSPIR